MILGTSWVLIVNVLTDGKFLSIIQVSTTKTVVYPLIQEATIYDKKLLVGALETWRKQYKSSYWEEKKTNYLEDICYSCISVPIDVTRSAVRKHWKCEVRGYISPCIERKMQTI